MFKQFYDEFFKRGNTDENIFISIFLLIIGFTGLYGMFSTIETFSFIAYLVSFCVCLGLIMIAINVIINEIKYIYED